MVAQIVALSPVHIVAAVLYVQMLEEDPIEGTPELAVVNSIDNWIQRRVCVTQPGKRSKH